ncbi:MAG: DnaA/Hda family protein [Pirellulales bacterium]
MDVSTLPDQRSSGAGRAEFAPASASGVWSLPLPGVAVRAARGRSPLSPAAPRELVIGPENRLVLAAVRAVLDGDTCYNPIVFWGPSGTGKSHLAHGLAQALLRHNPPQTVRLCSAADFAHPSDSQTDDAESEQSNVTGAAGLLVVEDIQHLAGKPLAQQRLAYAIDDMLSRDAQIILTAGFDPLAQPKLTPRLASRLAGGLLVPLRRPGPEARLALIKAYALALAIVLPPSAAKRLAVGMATTAPQLQGALVQLELIARRNSATIDDDLVAAFLAQSDAPLSQREAPAAGALRAIAAHAARYYEVKLADVRSPSRRKAAVAARALAIFVARKYTDFSLERMGDYFGGRDHTTVLHSLQKMQRLVTTDPATAAAVSALERSLKHQ